MLHETSDITA